MSAVGGLGISDGPPASEHIALVGPVELVLTMLPPIIDCRSHGAARRGTARLAADRCSYRSQPASQSQLHTCVMYNTLCVCVCVCVAQSVAGRQHKTSHVTCVVSRH